MARRARLARSGRPHAGRRRGALGGRGGRAGPGADAAYRHAPHAGRGDVLRRSAGPHDLPRLAAEVAAAGRDPAGWLLIQAVDVSSILSAKYRAIRWAVGALAPSAALALAWSLTAR
ncbi:Pycsar system effector family protein [Streptomyces endophytica]|uniref:DUF5706 domain-containing protein n=1 Tax=Streptomyces endophytica TaxID=2991496 RepID=A0ABY6PAI2_9ACTN|nr:Pycsar system effector family protein [Streptomyces endophytica]UZJ30602.1 DUF5706 domain-containing protein [Streptomyces endophytica]